ncbi:hypothetical protein GCM10010495_72640 [Kitasatospora herbaricolor]|nr:hypothetical protein GCM10010495_72640 [Kitasatospora herbaricolor]
MAAVLAVPVECGSSRMSAVSRLSDRLSPVSGAVGAEVVMAVPCLGAWAVAWSRIPAGAGRFITNRSRTGTIGGEGTSGGGTAYLRLRREPSRTARPMTQSG